LQFVSEFRWPISFVSHYLYDSDIAREIRLIMHTRVNMLIRKFHKCSTVVKLRDYFEPTSLLHNVCVVLHCGHTLLPTVLIKQRYF